MTAINCLYQHPDFVALHKPAGVPFHSEDSTDFNDQASEGMVCKAKAFMNEDELYPVHRLDRMTSGLMLFARNKSACSELSQLFQKKEIEKYYLAISTQKPKKKQGAVIGDMEKSRSGSYMLTRTHVNPAITRFFAKKLSEENGSVWFFILKPETGKTHQLRVALKSLGSPILGDKRYAGYAATRGYLHAYKIRFDYQGRRHEVVDPNFSGEEFNLASLSLLNTNTNSENLPSDDWLMPENLSWPSGAFQLD